MLSYKSIISLSAMLLLSLASACQGTAIDNEKSGKVSNEDADIDSVVYEFDLDEKLYTASANYMFVDEADSQPGYLTVSTSVQWPEELGKYKIDALHDTIISLAFGVEAPREIRKAVAKSVTDVAAFGLPGKVSPVTSVPDSAGMFAYYSNRMVQLVECTQQTVTYSVSLSEYMGGAHPNSNTTFFTFILESGKILSPEILFTGDWKKAVEPVLMQSIASLLGMSVEETKGALLASPFDVSPDIYISNGIIIFHYNPYEILPYSAGAIDAPVSPYEVSAVLTPEAHKLLME